MDTTNPITGALQQGIRDRVFPGAVLLVRCAGEVRYHQAVGSHSPILPLRPANRETVYDLASLTKPLATGTGILCLVQDGRLDLEESIGTILTELRGTLIARATVRDILCHRSGLPGYRPYYQSVIGAGRETSRQPMLAFIGKEPLEYEPRTKSLYSDLGFMLLGFAIERRTEQSLKRYCEERIFGPLRAYPLAYREVLSVDADHTSPIAPTEQDPWRGRLLQGEVHDENAYVLGGVAGHAGLFGTALAVSSITQAWLNAYHGRESLLDSQLVRQFVSRQAMPCDSSWALGWDTPSSPSSSGKYFSASSFGHLGFTGTSIWIDPEAELEVILLTNRVHPTRENNNIREFRPMIHDVVYEKIIDG
ncbi:MAG: serine hydrolase [Nitrospirales bacterium]|nr:serine hydrolase [Nitrospira sp.]MDR4500455.1 serine hydrolase [Nitrospirales bacterium]